MSSSSKLENIYHKSQAKIWDGRGVLSDLVERHGGIVVSEKYNEALCNIFSVILEGELAAWNVSLQLAEMLKDPAAKMAATSQAHDESRHFYVMRDYLGLYGRELPEVPTPVREALDMVLSTKNLAKKLLGMQLMVEPVALTIFQEVRRVSPEPILSDLLELFEIDEARHVALGVYHLPAVVKDLGPARIMSLIMWQMKIFMLELEGLSQLKPHFEVIGLDAEELFSLAEKKQLDALRDFVSELGMSPKVWEPIRYFIKYQKKRVLS